MLFEAVNARLPSVFLDLIYLVECQHLTGHGSAVVEGDPHPPVDLVYGKLAATARTIFGCIPCDGRERSGGGLNVRNRPVVAIKG